MAPSLRLQIPLPQWNFHRHRPPYSNSISKNHQSDSQQQLNCQEIELHYITHMKRRPESKPHLDHPYTTFQQPNHLLIRKIKPHPLTSWTSKQQLKSSELTSNFIILNILQMPQNSPDDEPKRNYSKIPIKKRMLLVKLVLKKGVPIGEAIEELGLKITTARFIINKYKETGTFPRRKFKKRVAKPTPPQTCKKEQEQKGEEKESNGEDERVSASEVEVKKEEVEDGPCLKMEEAENRMFWVYYPWFML